MTRLVLLTLLIVVSTLARAAEDADVERTVRERAAREGLTDDAARDLTNAVRTITQTGEWASFTSLKTVCAAELARWCAAATTPTQSNSCLKRHRDSVSQSCELAMRSEFGTKPLAEPTSHNGVLLPVGSHFIYDSDGRIIGAVTTGPVTVNGMQFQRGQIRWHPNGQFWTGMLAGEEVIDGIRFKSTGIGIFFHPNGRVENSILAEDSVIDGVTYKGGTQIMFYPSGKVSSGELAGSGEFVAYDADGSRIPTPPTIRPFDFAIVDSSATKALCPPGSVPSFDCLPKRFVKLPTDPGERGKETLKGIDSDGDGLRDDVQRFIVLNWGFSERAVAALSAIARDAQRSVEVGGDISRNEAYELAKDGKAVTCYSRSVDQRITYSAALKKVIKQVTNTPERAKRYRDFDSLLSGRVFTLNEAPITELCGYDPAALPN